MSRRDKDRQKSLDALAKFAYSSAPAPPLPARPAPPAPRPNPAPARAPPAPAPRTSGQQEAERLRRKQMEERKEKLAEEKRLRDRRAGELHRSTNLQWRGGGFSDIPASIRRTGFDRDEPSTFQKIHDVLGDAREKEGRAKAKDKGKRQGGR